MNGKLTIWLGVITLCLCVALAGCDKEESTPPAKPNAAAKTPANTNNTTENQNTQTSANNVTGGGETSTGESSAGGEAAAGGETSTEGETSSGGETMTGGEESGGEMSTPPAAEVIEPPADEGGMATDEGGEDEAATATPSAPRTTGEKVKTAWHDAKVGDTMKYKMMGGTEMTWKVTKVTEQDVTVAQTIVAGGTEVPGTTSTYPRFAEVVAGTEKTKMPSNVTVTNLPDETLDIGGTKITCKVVETKMDANGKTITSKSWTSDQVPGGTVKRMSDMMGSMQVLQELVEFKRGG